MMKKLLFISSLMLIAATTWAAKADPKPATITQSDGTRLTVLGYGDEDFHWYTTTDGVLLAHEGTDYFVAAIDEQGNLQPTRQLAHETPLRSVQENALIAMQAPRRAAFNSKRNEEILKADARRKIPVGTPNVPYFPHTGTPKAMVILVQFSDLSFSVADPVRSFNDYLNGEGALENYGLREDRNNGSVAQYFKDMSQGLFTPQFDVYGPVTLQNSWTYYGKNSGSKDQHSDDLVKEACRAIADTVDFSAYDSNGDQRVDLVYIIYAGYAESISGNSSDCIWPKSGQLSGGTYNGISVSRYGINNELNYSPDHNFKEEPYKRINGIGLFCHEFSHTMGLPDMYPTTASAMAVDNQTMEFWDLMDSGEYTDNGYTPTPYTPWEREVMEWVELEELTDTAQLVIDEDKFYKISSEDNTEQVILQNIQNNGWYSKVLSHGLIVYHVDYTNANGQLRTSVNLGDYPNNIAGKPGMTIFPADSLIINYYRIYSDEEDKSDATPYSYAEWYLSHTGDLYPGESNVIEIKQFQLNRSVLDRPIYNITEQDGLIRLDYLKDYLALRIEASAQTGTNSLQDIVIDLSGRKVAGRPLSKGIYINNGKKFVVR